MGICVKTLKKMYKQFDIPQRLHYWSRPDIYFDVKDVVDCTALTKSAREVIYNLVLKLKPKDMRVERDVVIHTKPMTIKYKDDNFVEKSVDMDGVDLKVDFYFPDYNTGFYYHSFFYYKSICKVDANSSIPSNWGEYLRRFKNDVQLMPFIPLKSFKNTYCDLEWGAKRMIERAISGEYLQEILQN